MIKVFRSPRDHFLYFEEADVCVRVVSSSGANLLVEVRPRRACGACGVYGLERVQGVLVGTRCRCCGIE